MKRFNLIEELSEQSPEEDRCQHLRKDDISPYCARDLKDTDVISFSRRYACDTSSLQLWCLDKKRWDKCIYYKGEEFKEPRLGPEFN